MSVYYNEFDKKKCAALQALMDDGLISKGVIDNRPIQEVTADDVKGYTRAHFFAGIGIWDYALQLAGWPDDRPVWTGSCPCQPFSSAGRQKGKADDRHLWPHWQRLIEQRRPATCFGEQVGSAIAHGWLDDVYQGMEQEGYAIGSAVLPACSVGAPHRRDRLWFVGNSEYNGRNAASVDRSNGATVQHNTKRSHSTGKPARTGGSCDVADTESIGSNERSENTRGCSERGFPREGAEFICNGDVGDSNGDGRKQKGSGVTTQKCDGSVGNSRTLVNTVNEGPQRHTRDGENIDRERRVDQKSSGSAWSSGVWIDCPDGKQRLVEPGICLLANGYSARVHLLHAAGDGIVPQVAAEFIMAFMDIEPSGGE